MSTKTKIQWCDSTVNPVMGCGGCELWPTCAQVRNAVIAHLENEMKMRLNDRHRKTVARIIESFGALATDLYHRRHDVASEIIDAALAEGLIEKRGSGTSLARVIADEFRCYAGILHTRHGQEDGRPDKHTNRGYADKFERPKLFTGRMAEAARLSDLSGKPRPGSAWLDGLPRLIFVSDMGDALSSSVPFEFLEQEIIGNVTSEHGSRNVWLWLTKRPGRMAEFGEWLTKRGSSWPDNLVAMTSVTSGKTLGRIDQLRRVPCRFRGLSIEPLWEGVEPDLSGIDWVIVGGESGGGALDFDLAWARSLRDRCKKEKVAFFVKQLGACPIEKGQSLDLVNAHGGDWEEWPEDLRIREFPAQWHQGDFRPVPQTTNTASLVGA